MQKGVGYLQGYLASPSHISAMNIVGMKKWVYSKEGLDTAKGNRRLRPGANSN